MAQGVWPLSTLPCLWFGDHYHFHEDDDDGEDDDDEDEDEHDEDEDEDEDDEDEDEDDDGDLWAPPSHADDGGPVCSARVDSWKNCLKLRS